MLTFTRVTALIVYAYGILSTSVSGAYTNTLVDVCEKEKVFINLILLDALYIYSVHQRAVVRNVDSAVHRIVIFRGVGSTFKLGGPLTFRALAW